MLTCSRCDREVSNASVAVDGGYLCRYCQYGAAAQIEADRVRAKQRAWEEKRRLRRNRLARRRRQRVIHGL